MLDSVLSVGLVLRDAKWEGRWGVLDWFVQELCFLSHGGQGGRSRRAVPRGTGAGKSKLEQAGAGRAETPPFPCI